MPSPFEDESQSLLEEPRARETHSWNPAKTPKFGLHADRRSRCTPQRQGMLGFCAVAVGLSVVVVLGVYMGGGFTPQIDDDLVAAAGNSTAGSVSATAATAALTRLNLGGGGGGGGRQLQSGRSQGYSTLSALLGWTYFSAWSLSFYPQVWYNYQRQSVVGLSFDYQLLNILGYTCYSIFASTLLWNHEVTSQYKDAFGGDSSLVTVQDAAFAIHGALLTLVTIGQCFAYERGAQKIALPTLVVVAAIVSLTTVYALVIHFGGGNGGPEVFDGVRLFSWLCWVYWLSMVKLGVTVCKYVPQALMNCAKQSTVGWSIGNVLLDFTGGVLSIGQLLLDGATLGWGGVVGDPIKFGLGFISMVFDALFMVQHYCLFTDHREEEERSGDGKSGGSGGGGTGEAVDVISSTYAPLDHGTTSSSSASSRLPSGKRSSPDAEALVGSSRDGDSDSVTSFDF